MDEDDYEEVDYDSADDDIKNEDTLMIPSSDVPDSIEFYKNYKEHSKQKMTDPCLTKYEKTKVLAERTQQVENGAVLYIPLTNKLTTAYSIALEEFNQKKIPFIICRPLPNSKDFEYWKLNDLMY
jgi:DNA-directed RNA polymerase subunit K/omega|tara:strand:+ start:1517 stop:1891 length:375 start_codon:yes stop_codon:yes gene_type:complete